MIIASSTRPDQPRWIRAGGPLQTVAVICRNTGWIRRPEPDDLENEGLWCQAVLGTATGCEVLRASKAAVDKWARAMGRNATAPYVTGVRQSRSEHAFSDPGGTGDQQNPVDLPLRLDDASASPTTPQGPHREQLI